jgi:hypothetical protein
MSESLRSMDVTSSSQDSIFGRNRVYPSVVSCAEYCRVIDFDRVVYSKARGFESEQDESDISLSLTQFITVTEGLGYECRCGVTQKGITQYP